MKRSALFFIALFFLHFASAQNVGIGTPIPTAKLHVNGTLKVTDGTQGAGKILTSDSSGLASWKVYTPASDPYYARTSICCNPWMSKNLNVSAYQNGDPIPKVPDGPAWTALTTGAYCYFNNDSTTYAAVYGKLYNWYAVNDPRGLAPEGWHVSTDFEWTNASNCLGGDDVSGGFLKEVDTGHWNFPNTGANDISSFTGRPAGYRDVNGIFGGMGHDGYFWSALESSAPNAWYRLLFYQNDNLYRSELNKGFGFSVRCLKD
ncbi:MAG TPA: fibrobacter succinogenes major paralogous domain-containing protein [Saprospiraceae bacterium]|nr:fibrobacter succinogenes major paralogous domain-containing protein [Saprospiraceae bacterium]